MTISIMWNKKTISKLLSVFFALLLWQIIATIVGLDILLVSPVKVLERLATLWLEPDFWQTITFSLSRIIAGFFLAFILGILLAMLAGRFSLVEIFLWPYVITIKSVPVASFIIISLIWLTAGQLSVFISFLMVFPLIYTNVLQGIKSTPASILEMAKLYQIPYQRKLAFIYLPQIKPYLISACSVSLGMSWKSGIAAEVIGISSGSIGEKLYESKVYFQTSDLFAWAVIIVLISVIFEKVFLFLLRRFFSKLEGI